MTRTSKWLSILALAGIFGLNPAWGGDKNDGALELLPAPQPCCKSSACSTPECCKNSCCSAGEASRNKTPLHTKVFSVDKLLRDDKVSPQMADTLIRLIVSQVQPGSWGAAGGAGNIEYYPMGRAIVVNQTGDVQDQIAKLLPMLQHLQQCACVSGTECPTDMPMRVVFLAPPLSPPPAPMPPPPAPVPAVHAGSPGEVPAGFICPAPLMSSDLVSGLHSMLPAIPSSCPAIVASASAVRPHPECWTMQSVTTDGKTKVAVHCGCDMNMTCDHLEVAMGDNRIKVAAGDNQISATGASFHATADSISCPGKAGCLVFEGNVQLRYETDSQHAIMAAERVTVNLTNGQVEMQPAASTMSPLKRVHGGIQ